MPAVISKPVGIKTMRVTWTTGEDDKDWNSRPVVDVYDGSGRHVGHIECCDREHWATGTIASRELNILVAGLTSADLKHGRFRASRLATGQDIWQYTAVVDFDFIDDTKSTFSCTAKDTCEATW